MRSRSKGGNFCNKRTVRVGQAETSRDHHRVRAADPKPERLLERVSERGRVGGRGLTMFWSDISNHFSTFCSVVSTGIEPSGLAGPLGG